MNSGTPEPLLACISILPPSWWRSMNSGTPAPLLACISILPPSWRRSMNSGTPAPLLACLSILPPSWRRSMNSGTPEPLLACLYLFHFSADAAKLAAYRLAGPPAPLLAVFIFSTSPQMPPRVAAVHEFRNASTSRRTPRPGSTTCWQSLSFPLLRRCRQGWRRTMLLSGH